MGHEDNEKVFLVHGPSILLGALLGVGLKGKQGGSEGERQMSEVQDLSF
jgi:hypothetical protein